MKLRQQKTIQVTTFHVADPPSDGAKEPQDWMAVATIHVFDPARKVKNLTAEGVILSGEAMRIVDGKGFADTEDAAVQAAVRGLLFQLKALGLPKDVGES
jgi:hypothetical protein